MTTNYLDKLRKTVGPVNFALFMRTARTTLDLTQVEMAKKLKMAPGTLCDLEKGRQIVSPKLAAKIARAAGLSEQMAVELCLEDHLARAKLPYSVRLSDKKSKKRAA